ncbi:MAG: glycosyltransferase family 4 protein [Solirubrobacterales bacterium]|nr:glycosyltransferase family 4 protein [Solirubrobacterales bacterium]
MARALARRLPQQGWDATVVSGSLPGHGDAEHFYTGLDVHPVCFEPLGDTPMHPSYEDRDEAGDGVFAALDDREFERHVTAWARHLDEAGAARADVLHLHHLTPINEAAARVAPETPVVAHLHGTELLMLEQIADGAPDSWHHADAWARRMRAWAQDAHTVIVPSELQRPRVEALLGVDADQCVVLPNGVDLELFARHSVDRAAHWRRHLAEDPKGWLPGEDEGSIGYSAEQAARVAANPVVVYVGRFTAVKRLDVLIRAWSAAQERFAHPASLAIVGGHPGEWEGEHPAETIRRTGAHDVYLAGWQPQELLPDFLAASDVLVLPSVREQFGLVVVEAMACGVPPIAVDRFGPREIVDDGATGWLVEPDDEATLADALVAAVNEPDERARRGAAAHEAARERYGWDTIAEELAAVLDEAAARPTERGRAAPVAV